MASRRKGNLCQECQCLVVLRLLQKASFSPIKKGKYQSAKRKAPLIDSLILPLFFDIPKLRFYTNSFFSNDISHHISYLKWRDLRNCEVTLVMKPNSSCFASSVPRPFINSCTLNRDTVCHPVSPFSSEKVKELTL